MNLVAKATLVVALLLVQPAVPAEEVGDYVRGQMDKQHIPGLALVVAQNGAITRAEGYGLTNIESRSEVQPETIFQIQSITKTFTATAIMLLAEEGKLSVEDKLTQHLSDLPDCWKEITLRHLLTHTSGIKDFINEPTLDLRHDITPVDVIKSLKDLPLNFPPGQKYAYCNTGYHLLGMIIHKITGKMWGEYLRQRIFEPLDMKQTRVISISDVITNRAAGYVWEDGRLKNGYFLAPTILAYAGGGLRSTVLDLAKWDAALWSDKILKQPALDQMWTAARLNDGTKSGYGFGWNVGELQGHPFVSHTGSHMTGFKTVLMRFLDKKLTVIVLTNQRAADQTAIAKGVAGFYLPDLRGKSAGN